jgi:hypothetical protein
MKLLDFKTVLLCDSTFQDVNKKWNVIGIYPGSLKVPGFPVALRLALYIELAGPEDVDFTIDVLLDGKKFAEIQGEYRYEAFDNAPMIAVMAISGIELGADKPTSLKLVARVPGARPRTILTKQISQH